LGSLLTRLLLLESGVQFVVNSGADWLSHSVIPNQNVGRSWKFHVVPPAPDAFGCVVGSRGSTIV
jgi:hypothetical protein